MAKRRKTTSAAGRPRHPLARSASGTFEDLMEGTVATALPGLLRDVDRIADLQDPLAAELLASEILGIAEHGPLWATGRDAGERWARAIVRAVVRRPGPPGLALLLAVAAVSPPGVAPLAQEAARKLTLRGIRRPRWAAALATKPILVGSWRGTEPHGDQDVVVLAFERPGVAVHGLALLIDHNLGGAVKDAFPVDHAEFLTGWEGADVEMSFVPCDDHDAARILTRGTEVSDSYRLFSPLNPDYWATRALLLARAQLLPTTTDAPPEPEPWSEEARVGLVEAFLACEEGARAIAVYGCDRVGFVASTFIDFGADYGCGDPLRWSPTVADIFLCDWYPRKVTADDETDAVVPDVLVAWARFAGARRGLSEALIQETVSHACSLADEFRSLCAKPSAHGMAKRIALAMRGDGVDVSQPEAVQCWIDEFNVREQDERRAVVGQPG